MVFYFENHFYFQVLPNSLRFVWVTSSSDWWGSFAAHKQTIRPRNNCCKVLAGTEVRAASHQVRTTLLVNKDAEKKWAPFRKWWKIALAMIPDFSGKISACALIMLCAMRMCCYLIGDVSTSLYVISGHTSCRGRGRRQLKERKRIMTRTNCLSWLNPRRGLLGPALNIKKGANMIHSPRCSSGSSGMGLHCAPCNSSRRHE